MIRRGEIYFADLEPSKGREQKGARPVLVVSSDALNASPLVVVVVPGTDAKNIGRDYPVNVRVPKEDSGLPRDTVFLCFQLRALDPARFADASEAGPRPAGKLSEKAMARVDEALRVALALG